MDEALFSLSVKDIAANVHPPRDGKVSNFNDQKQRQHTGNTAREKFDEN